MNNNLPSWLQSHTNIFDNEQIHHAFIISGSKDVGKSLLIESLAEKILNNKIQKKKLFKDIIVIYLTYFNLDKVDKDY